MVTGRVHAIAKSIDMFGKSSLSHTCNAFSRVAGLLASGGNGTPSSDKRNLLLRIRTPAIYTVSVKVIF